MYMYMQTRKTDSLAITLNALVPKSLSREKIIIGTISKTSTKKILDVLKARNQLRTRTQGRGKKLRRNGWLSATLAPRIGAALSA
jgi:hypothetical protein